MNIFCEVCDKKIKCNCNNERNIPRKYRTCWENITTYPLANFIEIDGKQNEIHICSSKCNKILMMSGEINFIKKGYQIMYDGNNNIIYDPFTISEEYIKNQSKNHI